MCLPLICYRKPIVEWKSSRNRHTEEGLSTGAGSGEERQQEGSGPIDETLRQPCSRSAETQRNQWQTCGT